MDEAQIVAEIGYGRLRELLEGNRGMEVNGGDGRSARHGTKDRGLADDRTVQ